MDKPAIEIVELAKKRFAANFSIDKDLLNEPEWTFGEHSNIVKNHLTIFFDLWKDQE